MRPKDLNDFSGHTLSQNSLQHENLSLFSPTPRSTRVNILTESLEPFP
jgi:hypothetical protein